MRPCGHDLLQRRNTISVTVPRYLAETRNRRVHCESHHVIVSMEAGTSYSVNPILYDSLQMLAGHLRQKSADSQIQYGY